MSIQTARETIAANAGALLAADGSFFNGVQSNFDRLKVSGSHPADFRRLRNSVADWSKAFAAKPGWDNAKDKPVYDGALGWVELLDAEISNATVAAGAFGAAAKESGWRDAATGKPVNVYSPSQRIAGNVQPGQPSVGDILAAKLIGTKDASINAALSEGTDSAGGYSIPSSVLPQFFDKLRAKTQFIQAGARTLMLDGMKTRIMRTTADPTAAWRAENAAVTESAPTFDAVDFLPQSLAVLVKVSEELLQDSVNIAQALESALIGSLSVELDRACLFGAGSSNEPLGLFGTTGVNSVSMGTNGATPTSYDELLDALYENELDNANAATAAIMHPRTAKTLRKLKDSTGQPLMLPPALRDLPMLSTTSVPITQTQGTASGVCSTTIVGDFAEAILGLRQSLTIKRLDQTYAGNLQIGFLAYLRADVGVSHPSSFTKIIGIKP